jgi:hypothetical protein
MKAPRNVRMGTAFAVASAVLSLPDPAYALSCDERIPRFPQADAAGVPTNTILWGYGRSSYERLLGPNGDVVPVERRSVPIANSLGTGSFAYPVLVPIDPLAPDTRYTLVYDSYTPRPPDAEPLIGQAVFTTGTGPSLVAPPLPVVLGAESLAGQGWGGPVRYISLDIAHQGLLLADIGGLGDVTSIDDLFLADTTLALYDAVAGNGIEWVTTEQALGVGPSDCGYWPSGAADRQNARLGVLDLAGNFSGWVDVELELPSVQEAQAAAEADTAAAYDRTYGERDGRPPVCTFTPSRSGGSSGAGAWLTLAVAGLLHATRRYRRPPR